MNFDFSQTLLPPSFTHLLGTDPFGRDVLGLLISTGASSLAFSIGLGLLIALLSWSYALAVAFSHPWIQKALRAALDLLLAFPGIILSISAAAILGSSIQTLVIALGLGAFPAWARLALAKTQELATSPAYEAARATGASPTRLAFNHVGRSVAPLLAVKFPSLVVSLLISEASLSFLGIGAPLGTETWGTLLYSGREYLIEAPWIALGGGIPLLIASLAIGEVSDTLVLSWPLKIKARWKLWASSSS